MGKQFDKFIENYRPMFESATYLDRAANFADKKLGGVETNESIVAALIIAQAIRQSSHDLVSAISDIEDMIYQKDVDLSGIESILEKLEATIYDAGQRR